MLSYIMYMIFMIPLCFFTNWWLVNLLMLLIFFMFLLNFHCGLSHISYLFGFDTISYIFILLSFWICILMILASEYNFRINYYSSFFMVMVVLLMLMLFCTFSGMGLLVFYIFFEGSLIPTLMLILGWGYQPERLRAGVYLLFYTLFGSLPLLFGLMYMYMLGDSLLVFGNNMYGSWMIYLCMIFAFLVSMPMFLVHLWLPSAHVEAPVAGSMILAGVLLKLGGYGLMRMMYFLVFVGLKYNWIWVSISLVGGIMVGFICMRQVDLKSLIAYSSVSHMGIVIGGLMTMSYWGYYGSLILMVGHGLCSSGLFCLANISYERMSSRSLLINKGLMNFMPSMSFWWFLLSSCNMAAPPSLNLLGEIELFGSLVGWSSLSMMFLFFVSFLGAAYTLYMYSYTQHGMYYSGLYSCSMGYLREYLLLFMHWFPLNFFVFKVDVIMI